jgi:hypothetical protein
VCLLFRTATVGCGPSSPTQNCSGCCRPPFSAPHLCQLVVPELEVLHRLLAAAGVEDGDVRQQVLAKVEGAEAWTRGEGGGREAAAGERSGERWSCIDAQHNSRGHESLPQACKPQRKAVDHAVAAPFAARCSPPECVRPRSPRSLIHPSPFRARMRGSISLSLLAVRSTACVVQGSGAG